MWLSTRQSFSYLSLTPVLLHSACVPLTLTLQGISSPTSQLSPLTWKYLGAVNPFFPWLCFHVSNRAER